MSPSTVSPPDKIALGCVTFGREIARADAFRLLDHAAKRGVTCFDTAAAYGGGASELILGEWLGAHREARARLTVATKVLPPYSPASIELGLRQSLARLKLDRANILFLHQWHPSILDPEVLAVLEASVRRGAAGAIGLSNVTAVQLAEVLERQRQLGFEPIRVVQNIHNFAVRGFDSGFDEASAHRGVARWGYSPLGAGFLTGKHHAGTVPGSRFDLVPGHKAIYFTATARDRLGRLEAAVARAGLPVVLLALAWALRDPHVDTVLVGGRTPEHLDQAFAALQYVGHSIFTQLADA